MEEQNARKSISGEEKLLHGHVDAKARVGVGLFTDAEMRSRCQT